MGLRGVGVEYAKYKPKSDFNPTVANIYDFIDDYFNGNLKQYRVS